MAAEPSPLLGTEAVETPISEWIPAPEDFSPLEQKPVESSPTGTLQTEAIQAESAQTEAAQLEPTRLPESISLPKASQEPQDYTSLQRIVLPTLGVDARIILKPFVGKTWDIRGIRGDVAWLEGTSHPADGGNTVLAGHIMVRDLGKGPFRYLDRLKPGDKVVLYTRSRIYTYQVREQMVVNITDGSVTANTGKPQLTLLTCSNWDGKSETYLRRRVVFADLIQVNPIAGGELGSLSFEK